MKIKTPNPQGKGQLPVLSAISGYLPACIVPKKTERISTELFTSLFILESRFSFKPVIGREYFLYYINECFVLSLIAPHERRAYPGEKYVGECILQTDITWTLKLSAQRVTDREFMSYLEARKAEFERRISKADDILETLPYFSEDLPYYQRICAFMLSHSLGSSAALDTARQLKDGTKS